MHLTRTFAVSTVCCSFLLLAFWVQPALSKTRGPATVMAENFDRQARLDEIFAELKIAPNEYRSRLIAEQMWLVFMMTPDEETAEDLNKALQARSSHDFDKALAILNSVVSRHPDYAEGWNQRAFIHFLKQDHTRSIKDCERALELEPRHVGCMSGLARIFIQHMGRPKAGLGMLRKAMELHPWIQDRVLLNQLQLEEL